MKIAVFDVDDTLIKHGHRSESYYTGPVSSNFKSLLNNKGYEKIYLYTNLFLYNDNCNSKIHQSII